MRLYKSGATSVKFTDGSLTSATVTVTPPAGAAVKFALAASTLTPAAGASVNLTTTAQDTYGNTATTYAGSKNLVFSGAGASARGHGSDGRQRRWRGCGLRGRNCTHLHQRRGDW